MIKLNEVAFRIIGFSLVFAIVMSSVTNAQIGQSPMGIQSYQGPSMSIEQSPYGIQNFQGNTLKTQPKPFPKTLRPGVNYFSHGEIGKANNFFENKVKKADTPYLKIKTKAIWANSLSRASKIQKNDKGLMKQAEQKYLTLLPKVKGDLRLNTYNNYGALLLRQNRANEALSILKNVEEIYTLTGKPKSRARYLYNLAKANEKTGDFQSAKEYYRNSAKADKDFLPASRAFSRMLFKQVVNEKLIDETVSWLNQMANQNKLDIAEKTYRSIFSKSDWTSQKHFDRIIISLVQFLTVSDFSMINFKESWGYHALNELSKTSTPSHKVALEIMLIYDNSFNFPIKFKHGSQNKFFKHTLNNSSLRYRKKILSSFAKGIGDWFYKDLQMHDKAFQRYALAWTLNNTNTEAALFATNFLLEKTSNTNSNSLFIKDLVRYSADFIHSLFRGKGEAYRTNDFENIFRFHTILGLFYEKQNIWGSSNNPQSTIFQYERAIKAHKILLIKQPNDAGSVIGIRVSLAKAYLEAKYYKASWLSYLNAIEGAIKEGDIIFAKENLINIDSLSSKINLIAIERRRLEEIKTHLQ